MIVLNFYNKFIFLKKKNIHKYIKVTNKRVLRENRLRTKRK
jgi:hypothetical protein